MSPTAVPTRRPRVEARLKPAARAAFSFEQTLAGRKIWDRSFLYVRRLRLSSLIDRAFRTFEGERILDVAYAAKVLSVAEADIVADLNVLASKSVLCFGLVKCAGCHLTAIVVEPGAAPILRCSPATLCTWATDHVSGAKGLPR